MTPPTAPIDPEKVKEIAGYLTGTQRKALLAGLANSLLVARALLSFGLFRSFARDAISRLVWMHDCTPLGLAVRQYLEKKNG